MNQLDKISDNDRLLISEARTIRSHYERIDALIERAETEEARHILEAESRRAFRCHDICFDLRDEY